MKKIILFFLIVINCYACKQNEGVSNIEKNVSLKELYSRYRVIRENHENADKELFDFELALKNIFENKLLSNDSISSILKDNAVFFVKSNDGKLIIPSWEVIDSGCLHAYRSMYRYENNKKIEVDYFVCKEKHFTEIISEMAYPYQVHILEDDNYLINSTSHVCGAHKQYSIRMLAFKNNKRIDCKNCFNGKPFFYTEIRRGLDIKPIFDSINKAIIYPELVPYLKDGEDTGFEQHSGKFKKLTYKNGVFE